MGYPPYPTPHTTISAEAPKDEQSADRLPWPVWRIVHNRRWTRSVTGPDYLAWQGRVIAIVFDREEGGYRFDLGEGRSAGSWPMALAAKTAAAEAVLAMPLRDKERAAAIRLLRENEALRETQERMNDDDIIDD